MFHNKNIFIYVLTSYYLNIDKTTLQIGLINSIRLLKYDNLLLSTGVECLENYYNYGIKNKRIIIKYTYNYLFYSSNT